MATLKAILLCLFIGLAFGFLANSLVGNMIGMSAYIITIPAAFGVFITRTFPLKKDD